MHEHQKVPIRIQGLNAQWRALAHLGLERTYARHSTINMHGCQYFHLILQGSVNMVRLAENGEEWDLYQAGPDCLINDLPAISHLDNYVTYYCIEPVHTLQFPAALLEQELFYQQYPDLALNLLHTVMHKLSFFFSYAAHIAPALAEERICVFLYNMLPERSPAVTIHPKINQVQLAARCGLHPTTVARVLRKLRRAGIIGAYTKNKLEILKPEKLRP